MRTAILICGLWLLCFAFRVSAQSNTCVNPPPNMIAWWTFDESQGRIANDIAGAINNVGNYIGNPFPGRGMVGNALCFSQTNDFVSVPNQAEIDFGGACTNVPEFTIDAWIRPSTNGNFFQTLLNKRGALSGSGYSLFLTNDTFGLLLSDESATSVIGGPRLLDGQWHFVAATIVRCEPTNRNTVALFVDGNFIQAPLRTLGDLGNTNDLLIGGSAIFSSFDKFNGCIDELEIYKRALTTNELLGIFFAGPAGKCRCQLSFACSNVTVFCSDPLPPPPPLSSSCCTNVSIQLLESSTNGIACSNTIFQVWQATGCSSTALCRRFITVLPVPPILTCSNIFVPCGVAVPSNPPAVFSPCCTNFAFSLRSPTNAGSGPAIFSRLWTVTDLCCGLSATCTQIVTIGFPTNYVDPGGLLPGFESSLLPPSFDNTNSGPVPLCFSICFCGVRYTNVWINEAGNVTLDGPFSGHDLQVPAFAPAKRLCSLDRAIFAPFWADADTTGAGTVGWGCSCAFVPGIGTRSAFGATWRGVGYQKGKADKTNSFQVIIIDRSDRAAGDFDLQYRYASIQWDTAESCAGLGGQCFAGGGIPARAGYGHSTNCCFELPGSGKCDALLDSGGNALVKNHLGVGPAGVFTWQFKNCSP